MVESLAYIVLVFTAVQFAVVIVNWIWNEKLPRTFTCTFPSVSVLIPARNEAATIRTLLDDLLRLDYRPLEIIVCDDNSTDNTAAIVQEYAAVYSHIRLIRSQALPSRWTGKNFACHQLAEAAVGEYLLFLDADVHLQGQAIERALYIAERYRLGLLSIFPRQLLVSLGEKSVVPLMNFILLTLLPLVMVRIVTDQSALAAANGQFMLFNAYVYRQTNPHKRVRNYPVEDIQIARYYKKTGIRIGCFTGDESVSCRMYRNFKEAVNGFSRSLPSFFGGSFLIAITFWVLTTFGVFFVYRTFPMPVFFIYLVIYFLIRVVVSLISKQSILYNILLCPLQQLSMGWVIVGALIRAGSKNLYWKGRKI